ncbi:hypothetical protein [Streptomyces lunalinharesii]|uniref:Lipoprotein n=1 Tax=Streptomyces lunalinharesii TaxID=333384 RepID=A0ABN3SM30_9ACTN
MTAGYLGIGADHYGSFSNPAEAGTGGPGQKPNNMVIRGSGDQNKGFAYLTGAALPGDLSLTADKPARVHLTVLDGKVTAGFRPPGGVQKLIADFTIPHDNGQAALPDTLKLGLSAATSGSTSNYVVRNLVISLPPASSQKRVVFAGKSLPVDITVDYPDKNDAHNTVANLLAQQNA